MLRLLRLPVASMLALTLASCAGDPGADTGLPACNARPVDPAGFQSLETEEVELDDRIGRVYHYRAESAEIAYYYGVPTALGRDLPSKKQLPLASLGAGRLRGEGLTWAFVWNDTPPCDPMTVYGEGFTKASFTAILGATGVTPREEEEGEGGPIAPGAPAEPESEEEEIAEGLPQAGGRVSQFVGVFEVAPTEQELADTQAELNEVAPNNAGVAPADCWKGLPSALGVPRDRFVAALSAQTGNELDFFIERVGRAPLFYGRLALRARCSD